MSFWIVTAKKLGRYKRVLLKKAYKNYEILRLMEQSIDIDSNIEIGGVYNDFLEIYYGSEIDN